jgi:hypothetical protein
LLNRLIWKPMSFSPPLNFGFAGSFPFKD